MGVKIRRLIFPLIKGLSGPISGTKGILVKKAPLPKGPKIYAVTHTNNKEDIAWAMSFADEQAYLFTNGYNELMHSGDGIAMWLAGVIYVDRYDKANREASIKKAERVIKLGGNILLFPEGVWNMSENLLVRKIYHGVYKIAALTNAPVIPAATMVYDGVLYAVRGKAIYLNKYEKEAGLTFLRNKMASMKWKLMERYGKTTRSDLLKGKSPEEYWDEFVKSYISTQEIYETEEEEHAHFLDDDDKAYIEVQETMEKLRKRYGLFDQRKLQSCNNCIFR
ncbi:MAG: 1-acyl-sn-glycerol-3-phosphate acyltransferase [Lachnospiraceae bacterium]|nr:1-acyl-sn-glycerol-3-phosphate acyltransferase [Lachnospiraceae bacterium]